MARVINLMCWTICFMVINIYFGCLFVSSGGGGGELFKDISNMCEAVWLTHSLTHKWSPLLMKGTCCMLIFHLLLKYVCIFSCCDKFRSLAMFYTIINFPSLFTSLSISMQALFYPFCITKTWSFNVSNPLLILRIPE